MRRGFFFRIGACFLRDAEHDDTPLGTVFMMPLAAQYATVPCPKCGTGMVLAAVTPHPIASHMERHTFLCEVCNQTKTYMLPAKQTASAGGR
jgi:5-methylcytosine-specific restriction endonuclease McrA